MKRIIILHVFPDEKFFDSISVYFDSMPEVENRYYFFSKDENHEFHNIKKKEKITIIHSIKDYVKELRRNDLDFVLFHRLVGRNYFYASIIKSKVKVIWWEWGYDIYCSQHHMRPLVKLDLYKPLTNKIINRTTKKKQSLFYYFFNKLIAFFYSQVRRIGVSRVDYMIPIIPIEYELMKEQCTFFKAKPLFNMFSKMVKDFTYHEIPKNILIGNSLTYTNNHLDIFEYLYKINIQKERKIIIPASYGASYGGIENFKTLSHFNPEKVIWLTTFLKYQDYVAILKNITHAVFGNIRQQAMGSISLCLKYGVKVYLYKNSIIYKQLKEDGYIIFSIEEDLTTQSLSICLPKEDAQRNFAIYNNKAQLSIPTNFREKLDKCL